MTKCLGDFELKIHPGKFTNSQIVVMLGENGTGKTTFIRMLAGQDQEKKGEIPELNVSYKPQKIAPKFDGTVIELLQTKLKDTYLNPLFITEVSRPLQLESIKDNQVQQLSGISNY